MIRPYRGILPRIPQSAFIDQAAQVIGDDTNIQDGSVLHGELDVYPVIVGSRVTVGHMACLHGCVVEDDCLIGIGAILLNGARIGRGSIVAAGSLVPEEMDVPQDSMVMGTPAKVRRSVTPEEKERFAQNAQRYICYRQDYREEPV